ncbi:MAG: FHA domain-containing protein [Coriobacteriales bacterium]
MKICPCCKGLAFDDAEMCYVCMTPFRRDTVSPFLPFVDLSSLGELSDCLSLDSSIGDVLDDEEHEVGKHVLGRVENPDGLARIPLEGLDDIVQSPVVSDGGIQSFGHDSSDVGPSVLDSDSIEGRQGNIEVRQGNGYWKVTFSIPGYPDSDRVLDREGEVVSVGRSLDNDVIVPDLKVSRHHAKIFLSHGSVWIRDVGSKNLTILDGVPVVGTRMAVDGSEVMMGSCLAKFERTGNSGC